MIDRIACEYCLRHELKTSTERQIKSVVSVWKSWAADRPFNAETVSEFLRFKQECGKSAYYRRSLRSTLVALLRFAGDRGLVRPVKRSPIKLDTWSAADVKAMIESAGLVCGIKARWWQRLITAAWYTGLSLCDLLKLEAKDVKPDGTVIVRRSKTGASVVAWMPPEIVEGSGPLWPTYCGREWFRLTWQKIVVHAGLSGPFKKLRRSSGTSVERLHPGEGHKHLANLRSTFERHYLGEIRRSPLIPERL